MMLPALLLAVGAARAAESSERMLPDFRLLDESGVSRRLSGYGDHDAVVIVAHSGRCATSRRDAARVEELRLRRRGKDVQFLLLDGDGAGHEELSAAAADYALRVPLLVDPTGAVTRSLGARRASEAFVIRARERRLAWRGPLSDVDAALRAALDGGAVPPSVVEAGEPGCPLAERERSEVSYERAARILRERCAGCHWDETGPAPMTSYEKVRGWAPMMREALLTGRMPPWTADPRFGHFANDISLSQEQRRELADWLEAGAPRGEGGDPLAEHRPRPRERWPMGPPDLVLSMNEPVVVPASGTFTWQYTQLLGPLPEDMWIRGAQINPGNLRVAHHVFVYDFPGPFRAYEGYQKNWKSKGMSAIRPAGIIPVWNWTPGRLPVELAPGVGIRVRKGRYLVLEVHYTPSGREESDRTEVGFYLHKSTSPLIEMKVMRLNKTDLLVPAGAREYVVGPQLVKRFSRDARLAAIRPHMHLRGARMRVVARFPDGRSETLLSVPRYDFDWQHLYMLKEPLFMPAGTEVFADGAYDNSRMNPANPDPDADAGWGLASDDEMFFCWLHYYEFPPGRDPFRTMTP